MTLAQENMDKRFRWSLACKLLALCCSAALALSGKHPPVHAQVMRPEAWAISNEDAVQDSNIASINKHLEHTDVQVDREDGRIEDLQSQLSELQGEERVGFGFLTVLIGGSTAFQFRARKQNDA